MGQLNAHVSLRSTLDQVRYAGLLRLGRGIIYTPADEALNGENSVLRVNGRLSFCGLANQPLAILAEGDDGWSQAAALGSRNDGGLAGLHDRHNRVGRA